jgi:hypothetical protein
MDATGNPTVAASLLAALRDQAAILLRQHEPAVAQGMIIRALWNALFCDDVTISAKSPAVHYICDRLPFLGLERRSPGTVARILLDARRGQAPLDRPRGRRPDEEAIPIMGKATLPGFSASARILNGNAAPSELTSLPPREDPC